MPLAALTGDPAHFASDVWGRASHLHDSSQGARGSLAELFPLVAADQLLLSSGIQAPALRVVQGGAVQPASKFTMKAQIAGTPMTGLVDPRKALAYFDEGATLVFQGMHRYQSALMTFVAELEQQLGHPCQANAYLTPPQSQGFKEHSDPHDVFVIQTHGKKLWSYEVEGEMRPLQMTPGMVLYLPAGTRHSAKAEADCSLHVTIGIHQVTTHSLVTSACDAALAELEDRRLPVGFAGREDMLREAIDALRVKLAEFDVAPVTDASRRAFSKGRTPRLQGGLMARMTVDAIEPTTPLRKRPSAHGYIDHGTDKVHLYLGDRRLVLPRFTEPSLQAICEAADVFTPSEIQLNLSDNSVLVLVRRLVKEGFLEVTGGN